MLSLVAGMGLQSVLSHQMAPADYGKYTLFVASISLVTLLMDVPGFRWVNTYAIGWKKDSVTSLFKRSGSYYFLAWLLVGIFGFFFQDEVGGYFEIHTERWEFLLLIWSGVLVFLFYNALLALDLGAERYGPYNATLVLPRLLLLAIVAACGYALPLELTLTLVLMMWVISYLLPILLFFPATLRQPKLSDRTKGARAELLRVGLRAWSVNLLGLLQTRSHLFLINYFLPIEKVGVFNIALLLAELIVKPSQIAGTVLFPKSMDGDKIAQWRMNLKLMFFSLTVSVMFAGIMYFGGEKLIALLFGQTYIQALPPMKVLLFASVFLSVFVIADNYVAAQGYPWIKHAVLVIVMLLTLMLNVVLIPRWGLNGAALASTVSYGVWFVLMTLVFFKMKPSIRREGEYSG